MTAISYTVGTIGMLLWVAPPTDSRSVAGTSAWRVPPPRSAAGAILRIELRSSSHFRFESRRRWAASEKVWIVEETFDCVGKRAGSHTPAARPAYVIELRQLIWSYVPFIEWL